MKRTLTSVVAILCAIATFGQFYVWKDGSLLYGTETLPDSVTFTKPQTKPAAEMRSAKVLAKEMYPGWNLGNTLEANDSWVAPSPSLFGNELSTRATMGEQAWQPTMTTKEIIQYVKSQGFRSVRIPCNWIYGHISNANTTQIDDRWMARVKEIVDYCIDNGLYVMLNDHYDGGWVETSFSDLSQSNIAKNCKTMKELWTQIANEFKDYDDHLLFAGLNEPNCENQEQTNVLIQYEQAFVDAVRATGGNNGKRALIVQGPSTDIEKTDNWFNSLPNDPSNNLMVEVHFYTPWGFCGMEKDADWGRAYYFWGTQNHVNGSNRNSEWGEESELISRFKMMKTKFVDKDTPVVIGEYGANWRQLGANQNEHNASIKLFHKMVIQYAIQYGMVPFVWDINHTNQEGTDGTMTIIDRANLSIFNQYAMDGIREGIEAAQWPY